MQPSPTPPRLLLVGVGRFGAEHLRVWQQLEREGRVVLAGLAVATSGHAQALAAQTGLPVHTALDGKCLHGVDLVDIATPAASHEALVRQCLPHAHVLVEKPLAADTAAAQALHALAAAHGRTLMTGHVYFHHPLTELLQGAAAQYAGGDHTLHIRLSNPLAQWRPGLDALREWIHAFDLFTLCAQGEVDVCSAWRDGQLVIVNLATAGGTRAQLEIGWAGAERVRQVRLANALVHVTALFDEGLLVTQRRDRTAKQRVDPAASPLRRQFEHFLAAAAGQQPPHPLPAQVERSLRLCDQAAATLAGPGTSAARARAQARADRPRVAVLGGGIFGSTCAVELAKTCDVTLFERHGQLLQEASWINQWRHHSGFHYPRSIDTIREVVNAKADFESAFEDVIVRDVEAYYAVSAWAREITPERYIATCRANDLKFEIVDAPPDLVDVQRVSVCLRTDEAVVEIGRLSRRLMQSLQGQPHVQLCLGTEVVDAALLADGRKRLSLRRGSAVDEAEFDFVINSTYANRNRVARWFGFSQRPLRFDLMEMSVLRIPGARRFMMTIVDAPFTSLTSTGQDELFMLSGIHESVLASEVTADGLPPAWPRVSANREGLLRYGLRYLPILAQAQHLESRVGVRTVEAFTDDFDGRPTVVTPHGFGVWSVLGGKIVTAVSNARHLAREIARQSALPDT